MVASAPGLAATLVSPASFQLFGPSALRVVQTGPDSNQPVSLTVATSPQGNIFYKSCLHIYLNIIL